MLCTKLHYSDEKVRCELDGIQDKIFRRKRLSTGKNFVHVYIEISDNYILKFN